MKEVSAVVAAVIGVIVMLFGVTALAAVLNGWVLSIIWKWFFVSTLNLPIISIPQAIGISLVVGFLTKQDNNCKKEEEDSGWKTLATVFIKPFVVLFIAWIVTWFM